MKMVKRVMSLFCVLCLVAAISVPAFAVRQDTVLRRGEVHCEINGLIGEIIEQTGTSQVGYETRACECGAVVGGMDKRIQYQDWLEMSCTLCDYEQRITYPAYWGGWYHVY